MNHRSIESLTYILLFILFICVITQCLQFLKKPFRLFEIRNKECCYRVIIITHLLCIGFYMNKSSNPIYMVVNRSIINSRSSRKRGGDTMTCWARFSIQTQPWVSSKFHLPNQLPTVMKRENLMQHSYLRGYMLMSTPMVWMTQRSYPHWVKPKAGGKLKSGQLNRLIQVEKGRKGTPLNP